MTVKKKAAGEDPAVQFDLPISILERVRKTVLTGLAVGLLLAVPQITTAWVNPAFASRGLSGLLVLRVALRSLTSRSESRRALNLRKTDIAFALAMFGLEQRGRTAWWSYAEVLHDFTGRSRQVSADQEFVDREQYGAVYLLFG